jgi:hypothetical protein
MSWHWLLHALGLDSASGPVYLALSGFVGDLALIGAAAAFLRHRNCEVKGCLRLGRHQTAAGHHVCSRHTPTPHLTAQDVHEAHYAHLRGLHHPTPPPPGGSP